MADSFEALAIGLEALAGRSESLASNSEALASNDEAKFAKTLRMPATMTFVACLGLSNFRPPLYVDFLLKKIVSPIP